jgi:hypothetical protein
MKDWIELMMHFRGNDIFEREKLVKIFEFLKYNKKALRNVCKHINRK